MEQGLLRLQHLTPAARQVYVMHGLQHNLTSLGVFYDDGCTIILMKEDMRIFKDGAIRVERGQHVCDSKRDAYTGMWKMTLQTTAAVAPTTTQPAGEIHNVLKLPDAGKLIHW